MTRPPNSADLLPPARVSSARGDSNALDHKAGWARRSYGLASAQPAQSFVPPARPPMGLLDSPVIPLTGKIGHILSKQYL